MRFLLKEEYNTEVDKYLVSKELWNELKEKFPNIDNTNKDDKLTLNVCEYIYNKNHEYKIFDNFISFIDGVHVQTRSHCVIRYKDIIYDFTSNQFVPLGLKPIKGPRVLFKRNKYTWSTEDYIIKL